MQEDNSIFGYDKLLRTEQSTYKDTVKNLGDFERNIPKFIDISFCFQQCFGEMEEPMNVLHTFAHFHYVQLPYTINTICNQIMTGYYLESKILLRHLFETLLQLKYFTKFPDKILPNLKKRIIKQMVEGITNDKLLYSHYYDFLCEYAHGFAMKGVERYDGVSNTFTIGNVYHNDNCKLSIYLFMDLLLGFINNYDYIFPDNTIECTEKGKELKKYVKDWCITSRDRHIELNGGYLKMHNAINDLIL